MGRDIGVTAAAPAPGGTYSQCVRIGPVVWASGQAGFDPRTREFVSAEIVDQTRQALRNVEAALQSCGASLDDVVRVGVFLAEIDERRAMDAVYAEFWRQRPPARTTVAVTLPPGMLVEIDAMAVLP